MKTLLLDPVGGVAGDMLLGLLLDLGLDPDRLQQQLKTLALDGWMLQISREQRMGISGTALQVHFPSDQPCRQWADIDQMLQQSTLSPAVRQRSRNIFRRLAEAEGRVHNQPPEQVHFHEVGAVDAIIDIVGFAVGLELLAIDKVICAPLPLGRGQVKTAHGCLPLPAPATLQLLCDTPVLWTDRSDETVTPTGAAIMCETAIFSQYPDGPIDKIGYGLGQRNPEAYANLVRGMLCTPMHPAQTDHVCVLETHLDDATPEWLGALLEDLMAEGALDAGFTPLQMKKNRPGVRLTVVCEPGSADRLSQWLLHHSTTAGVRRSLCQRHKLRSQSGTVDTPLGPIQVKHFFDGDVYLRSTPEYEDCRRLSQHHQKPLADVYRLVQQSLYGKEPNPQ